jgi:Domain of unknown function (DUF4129)
MPLEPCRGRSSPSLQAWVLAAALSLGAPVAAAAEAPSSPRWAEVEAARERIRQDPALAGKVTRTVWRWQSGPEEGDANKPGHPASAGLRSVLTFIAEGLRIFVWVAGALAILFVLLHLRAWWGTRADAGLASAPDRLPTHVKDLDIRPESLPDDVGAAAWQLWAGGGHRSALSLLYRGALSRLVHGHGVAVLASHTEGECLAACRTQADRACSRYFEQLVRAWQMAVYADHPPAEATVRVLCETFDAQLGKAGSPAAAGAAPAEPA